MTATLLIEVLIGLLTGVVGGMLGVGGSIVAIPALTIAFGPDQHCYQAAAMILNFFVVVPAVYQHKRAGALDGRTVLRLVPTAMLAVIVGVAMSELPIFSGPREVFLRALFGVFLLGVSAYELARLWIPEKSEERAALGSAVSPRWPSSVSWRNAALVALPTGFIAGLLGVGGGVIAVPLQRRLLHIPIRRAIANSAALIIATSAVGASLKNLAYAMENADDWSPAKLAAVLIPTAIVGSLIGARLTHVLPLRFVKIAFFGLLTLSAVRLMADVVAEANGHPPAMSPLDHPLPVPVDSAGS